jgi:hypothetical protein
LGTDLGTGNDLFSGSSCTFGRAGQDRKRGCDFPIHFEIVVHVHRHGEAQGRMPDAPTQSLGVNLRPSPIVV